MIWVEVLLVESRLFYAIIIQRLYISALYISVIFALLLAHFLEQLFRELLSAFRGAVGGGIPPEGSAEKHISLARWYFPTLTNCATSLYRGWAEAELVVSKSLKNHTAYLSMTLEIEITVC